MLMEAGREPFEIESVTALQRKKSFRMAVSVVCARVRMRVCPTPQHAGRDERVKSAHTLRRRTCAQISTPGFDYFLITVSSLLLLLYHLFVVL